MTARSRCAGRSGSHCSLRSRLARPVRPGRRCGDGPSHRVTSDPRRQVGGSGRCRGPAPPANAQRLHRVDSARCLTWARPVDRAVAHEGPYSRRQARDLPASSGNSSSLTATPLPSPFLVCPSAGTTTTPRQPAMPLQNAGSTEAEMSTRRPRRCGPCDLNGRGSVRRPGRGGGGLERVVVVGADAAGMSAAHQALRGRPGPGASSTSWSWSSRRTRRTPPAASRTGSPATSTPPTPSSPAPPQQHRALRHRPAAWHRRRGLDLDAPDGHGPQTDGGGDAARVRPARPRHRRPPACRPGRDRRRRSRARRRSAEDPRRRRRAGSAPSTGRPGGAGARGRRRRRLHRHRDGRGHGPARPGDHARDPARA